MADGEQVVNTAGMAASTPATQSGSPTTPPAGEKPAVTTPSQTVPYSRFQEVIQQKNAMASELQELKQRVSVTEVAVGTKAKVDYVQKHVQDLVSRGFDENVAKAIAETAAGIAKETIEPRVAPLEQASVAQQIAAWTEEFAEKHKDYYELEPKMHEAFSALPEHTQKMFASDPKGLEFLYSHVKLNMTPEMIAQAQASAAASAYETKGLKQAMSSVPGASPAPGGIVDRKALAEMPLSDYRKLSKEQRADLIKGLLSQARQT